MSQCTFREPPSGYLACTREEGHEGPCAHPAGTLLWLVGKQNHRTRLGSSKVSSRQKKKPLLPV